jgi:DNA adenine methylase
MLEPFLKWAGGKRWLVANHSNLFPSSFKTYFEPFLGSGAVFFHLLPEKAVLADKNAELIGVYEAIRNDWKGLLQHLKIHQKYHSKRYYYYVRGLSPRSIVSKAARFIYLNRTCFNGLYRVNMSGDFNVPKGTKSSVLLPGDDFQAVAHALRKCKLIAGDFAEIIEKAGRGDFVYVDPPYTVRHNNNNFIKYNETLFSWDDQVRLAQALFAARSRGAKILVSNVDHNSIRSLYSGFGIISRVHRQSLLAADSIKRRASTELIITNLRVNRGQLNRRLRF